MLGRCLPTQHGQRRAFAGYHDRAAAFDEELNPLYGIGL